MPTKKERSINATGLLKAAIERELGSPIDPKKYDNYIAKNDSVINNIRGNIDDLRGFSDEDWSGITDEDVTKIKNEILIRESMIKSCQDLVINRKKLTDRVRSRFPGI